MHLYELLEGNPTTEDADSPLFVLLFHTKPLKLSRLEPLFLTEDALLLWRQKNGLWSTTTGMTLFHLDALNAPELRSWDIQKRVALHKHHSIL